jgi:hypothetical protein
MKRITSISFVLIVCSAAVCAQSRLQPAVEQHVFNLGVDGPVVQHPVRLSDSELSALANDETMKQVLDQDPPITEVMREGLESAVVHLHSSQERDVLVVGSGDPFHGANICPFWVIRDLPTGPQVVFSTIALQVTIQRTSFNGLRNIEAFAATAIEGTTANFRFNGTKYVKCREKSAPLGQ